MHFEGEMPFKMHKLYFFSRKKKYVCLPYLKFLDPLSETHFFIYLAYHKHEKIPSVQRDNPIVFKSGKLHSECYKVNLRPAVIKTNKNNRFVWSYHLAMLVVLYLCFVLIFLSVYLRV